MVWVAVLVGSYLNWPETAWGFKLSLSKTVKIKTMKEKYPSALRGVQSLKDTQYCCGPYYSYSVPSSRWCYSSRDAVFHLYPIFRREQPQLLNVCHPIPLQTACYVTPRQNGSWCEPVVEQGQCWRWRWVDWDVSNLIVSYETPIEGSKAQKALDLKRLRTHPSQQICQTHLRWVGNVVWDQGFGSCDFHWKAARFPVFLFQSLLHLNVMVEPTFTIMVSLWKMDYKHPLSCF